MILIAILFGVVCCVLLAQTMHENGYHKLEGAIRLVCIVWTVYMLSLMW